MTEQTDFEIFLVAPPGLEPLLAEEARAVMAPVPVTPVPGGVVLRGGWAEVWRANICLRGAVRVLARVAEFRAPHLAQLDKRARRVDWAAILGPDRPVRVDAVCRHSKIYHKGAAADRIATAIAEATGAPIVTEAETAEVTVKLRIEDDLCTISLDTTGEPLHRRGHKVAVGKAPLRENLAALFLRQCGFTGDQTVVDPMCGSGTFVIEAAEIAAGLAPGRSRGFAFETLASHDPAALALLKAGPDRPPAETPRFFGHDRDDGAIRMSARNAERAGVADLAVFTRQAVSDLTPPPGPPGLVMVNPPYGARIGNRKLLFALYGSLGAVLKSRFGGWAVGLVTSDGGLAQSTGLAFDDIGPPIDLGGIKVRLYRVAALPR